MPGISIGSVSVSVVPSAVGFTDKLKSTLLPEADALGRDIGQRISEGINSALGDARVTVNLDMTAAEAQLRDFSAKLDELGSKNISPAIGLDDSRIVAALEGITVKLDELTDSVHDVRLELEDGSAVARLDEIDRKSVV